MTNQRQKLETALEREVFKLVEQIKENMYDHTMIWLNRTQSPIDREVAAVVVKIAQQGLEAGLLQKLDFFKANVDKELTEFTLDENPTLRSAKRNK